MAGLGSRVAVVAHVTSISSTSRIETERRIIIALAVAVRLEAEIGSLVAASPY